MREHEWRISDIALDKLDELPFGAIVIDHQGTILEYNDYESRLAHQQREAVLGRNFFHDVAPCTAVQAFEGRMQTFIKSKEVTDGPFDYFFPFMHGSVEVAITFVKLAGIDKILIAVERSDGKRVG